MKRKTFIWILLWLIVVKTPVTVLSFTMDTHVLSSNITTIQCEEHGHFHSSLPLKQMLAKFSKDEKILFVVLAIIMFIVILSLLSSTFFGDSSSIKAPKNRKEADMYSDEYRGDVPLQGDLPLIFYFYQMKDKGINRERQLFSAYLLLWVMEGALLPIFEVKTIHKTFMNKRYFKIIKAPSPTSFFEKKLWQHLSSSARDQIIDDKSFSKYMETHNNNFFYTFQNYHIEMAKKAYELDLLTRVKKLFDYDYLLTQKGLQVYAHVQQFYHSFKDYHPIFQSDSLWKAYLIFAMAFGEGQHVATEMKAFIPKSNLSILHETTQELDVFVTVVYQAACNLYQIYRIKHRH